MKFLTPPQCTLFVDSVDVKACPRLFPKPGDFVAETGVFVAVSGDCSSENKIAGFGNRCGQAFLSAVRKLIGARSVADVANLQSLSAAAAI